ncbi:hypothetical protein, partial [Aeromonas veronii]|uniref:hypothetical protein n=1 Tax=Aeromonas veronii TaxID=654 RepID=UPI0013E92E69
MLARAWDRVIPAGLSVTIPTPLLLELGAIPLATFEHGFCRRLEGVLEPMLRQQLMAESAHWQWESWERSWERLREAEYSLDEPVEHWLLRQLANGPSHWWPVLAGYVLRLEGAALASRLQPETQRSLCRQLADSLGVEQALTENTLWLSALRYFQCHPSVRMPDLPDSWQDVEPSSRGVKEEDAALLCTLFTQQPPSTSAQASSVTPWLRLLWGSATVRALVTPMLTSAQVGYWHALCEEVIDRPSGQWAQANREPGGMHPLTRSPSLAVMVPGSHLSALAVTPHAPVAAITRQQELGERLDCTGGAADHSGLFSPSPLQRDQQGGLSQAAPPRSTSTQPDVLEPRHPAALAGTPHAPVAAITRQQVQERGLGSTGGAADHSGLSSSPL